MGSLIFQMGVFLFLLLLTFSCNLVDSQIVTRKDVLQGNVFIDGKSSIAKIDSDFISATMDWWPPEKCDYGTCSWGQASLLNVEMDALQSTTNHSLQAELRERIEQYNQLWIGCQRQVWFLDFFLNLKWITCIKYVESLHKFVHVLFMPNHDD
ncbi:putative glycosidase [Helianthus annuus]|nr:putative glycosidase [Helianthus annuus]KAJ0686524.1 putative glycosidase [Helianthus annuus]KAJ0690339.1 putative glycosidase [Helianthus annuus]